MFERMDIGDTKKYIYAAAFVLSLLFATPLSAYGDRIELSNGQTFEGTIIGEESGRVQLKLDNNGARLWFSRDRILSIEKNSTPEADSMRDDIRKTPAVNLDDDKARAQKLLDNLREQPASGDKSMALPASPFIGAENAVVTIVVFSDYQ
jgi:hypothetical protein